MDALQIQKIVATRFGGLRDRVVTFPESRFVVVHGRNEAGKSSVAELISWLLSEPLGSAADFAHLGEGGTTVSGSLEGLLGTAALTAKGDYRLHKVGKPGGKGLRVTVGAEQFDAATWSNRLSGFDHSVLTSTYRLWGQDLHAGDAVLAQLKKLAMVGLGVKSPGEVLDQYLETFKKLTNSTAQGVRTVVTLANEIREVDIELKAAEGNSAEYLRLEAEIESLQVGRTLLVEQKVQFDRTIAALEKARTATGYRVELAAIAGELATLPAVSAEWEALATDLATLRVLWSDLLAAESAFAEVDNLWASALASSGWSAAQLDPVTFTESDRVALNEEDLRLQGLATAMSGATTDLSTAERVASEAALSAEQECLALGASVDAVRQAGRSLVDASAHVAATTRWRTAESAALGSRNDELEAEVALRTAESVDTEARATWDARATGMSAEEFIHKGGSRAATEATPSPRPFVAVGLVALVAVVAAAMQQWPLAAVAAAAGLALWLMPASRHAPVAPSTEPVTDNGAMAAALAANSAREKLGSARTALATATANHESRVVLAEAEQAAVAELSTSWGLPVASSPDDADRIRSSWSAAATKVADADQRRVQLSAASDAYAAAASAFEDQQQHLQARLESLGLASLMQPSTCADLAPKVREVVALRDKRATAEALVEEARASWLARVTPVLAEAAGRSGDWILDEADRYVSVLGQRGALLGRQTAAESTAAAIVADDPHVTALLDEGLSSVDLEVRQRSVTEQLAEIESEMSTLDQQRGEKAAIQQTLATAEDVARLRDLRGALKDEQAEIASRAAAVFAARTLLDATVQKYERDHQPALVNRASEIACSVAADWGRVFIQPDESRIPAVEYRDLTRGVCDASRLSTGGRALLYLAFRLALVEEDALKRGARLPVLCDDPLVHLDDDRAREVIPVFRSVAERGHQVLLFTCHGRTAEVAAEAGAAVVQL